MEITSEARSDSTRKSRFSSQPVGWLLGWFGLAAILVILVIAAWNRQGVIVILLGLLLAAAGLSRLWSHFSLAGVKCQRLISRRRLFPGEQTELTLRIANGKLLPLPWVQIDDQVPLGFTPETIAAEECRAGAGFLSRSTALLWYTAASWRCTLQSPKRGYYRVGPITISSGDIFGFYPRSVIEPTVDHIIVYPRLFPVAHLGIPSIYPTGDTRAERRIFEDPSRTAGIRDYSPYDSLRRIHWKATARHQKLKSKIYEPTTTLKVSLFLAVDSFPQGGERSEEDFELGISLAASIASYLTEQRSPVGLFVNTYLADSGQPAAIPPGSSTNHLTAILETLAKVTHQATTPFIEFIASRRPGLSWGTTLVFILSQSMENLTEYLANLKESGFKLLVLQVGEHGEPLPGTFSWHNIRSYADINSISSGEKL